MDQQNITATTPEPTEVRDYTFKEQFGNLDFRTSKMTYVSFVIIFLFVGQSFLGDPSEFFANMNETLRLITYIFTIVFLWLLYGVIYYAVVRENTFVKGIGIVKLRTLDFARGFAILLTLFVVASFV